MAKHNKSYRIRTTVGQEADSFLDVHLDQEYDSFEILSLKISDKDTYRLHNADYGVIVGRVLANGNFGVPNAKVSVFIPADETNKDLELWNLYPYTSTSTQNDKNIRYNLLPDQSVKDCHKAVGTFPNKTYLLENDGILEIFDEYYIYTTRTNDSGDYVICGVPTGMQTLHMDLDLSDCGILSQRPRDFVYKGYTIEQFDNPNQFKKDENIDSLSQIFSQNQPVYVYPFWGNEDNGDNIGITRADIQISFKFEPTCVFMGSAISDNPSNGVSKKCVPTNQMGTMDELTAGEGTIEMIRKTPGGNVEEFAIKGNQLINGNGVWCYQIPMNLDYMMTDEYGNMVPTDDPEKGIPTRARVRFRASLTDMENSIQSYYRAKYLIPNNPDIDSEKVDYNFGTYTDESSYRDLFWNGVYTVKSYIPRFQKSKRWRNERFSGIKACNYYGGNNPMPYNNMRIKLPFMFTVLCIFVKLFIKIVTLVNRIIGGIIKVVVWVLEGLFPLTKLIGRVISVFNKNAGDAILNGLDGFVANIINPAMRRYGIHCTFIGDGLCPDMEGWYFAPGCTLGKDRYKSLTKTLMENTLAAAAGTGESLEGIDESKDTKDSMNSGEFIDETSIDVQNTASSEEGSVCLTRDINYLVNCFEMNLAQEYRVIKFDFYNDWVNGVIYFPRWFRKIKRKKKYRISLKKGDKLITSYYKDKVFGCMNSETSRVKKSRYYTQQCSLQYTAETSNSPWSKIVTERNCYNTPKTKKRNSGVNIIPAKCHKKQGMDQSSIFGKKSGLVTEETTMLGQFVYYLKPCEWKDTNNGRVRTLLFATDIVLLGTLNDCDENGIPQAFKYLNNSSYIMPTNLALTTMDDDAYIYAAGDGTICASKNKQSQGGTPPEQEGVKRITPNYESTYSAYSKTDGDAITYEENDDPIPVTEAAGINWNYSGPGQDDVDLGKLEDSQSFLARLFGAGNRRFDFLYYPGGHFLGLSCTNSESNIKSCVNLKRICEVGASMSQRREEVRGYTIEGDIKYRYYVPTGLISNVDIEGASFRSMFATLNHHTLNATERNDVTGYKKYNFRFLRPDGFDGSLGSIVHLPNSPYNKKVNDRDDHHYITDATSLFERLFMGAWQRPDDYDPKEIEYTERRTVEDQIDDYFMFRFGLEGFSNNEQRKHFLSKKGRGYIFPQYENSFYFYFGLKDGSTALDEFKKQFFSECQSNNVMKEPLININETIDSNLNGKALLTIDNMIPPYEITVIDSTSGDKFGPKTFEIDTMQLATIVETGLSIGHEYVVTVTDSIDNSLTKKFVFGADAVQIDVQTVNFRVPATGPTNTPNKGGFIKINHNLTILNSGYTVGDGVSFKFRKVENGVPGPYETYSETTYIDAGGEMWHLYYVPSVGTFEVLAYYHDNYVSVYTTKIEDNRTVNLYVACDYLSYKPEYKGGSVYAPAFNGGLKNISNADWYNGAPFRGSGWENWLMRHTYYRQTENDALSYDNYIYTKGKCDVAIFGQPEKGGSVPGASLNGTGVDAQGNTPNSYSNDYDDFPGYVVDDTYTYIPTMYFNPSNKLEQTGVFRNAFDAMSYTEDGRAAADALDANITSYNFSDGTVTLGFSGGNGKLTNGHGCIVVFEDGTIMFPVVRGGNLVAKYPTDIYPEGPATQLLSMATIYPTLRIPSVYKPFYGEISAATWSLVALSVSPNENNETVALRNNLPASYKVEGNIFNGLTWNNHFYSGDTAGEYDTYFMYKNDRRFYDALTTNSSLDYECKRKITPDGKFGQGSWIATGFAYGREISAFTDSVVDINQISYAVREGIPPEEAIKASYPNVFTERYLGGFDHTLLKDSCSFETAFYEDLVIKLFDTNSEMSGQWTVYSDEGALGAETKYYISSAEIFDRSQSPMVVDEAYDNDNSNRQKYCHGYYNKNAKNDKKGEIVSVTYRNPLIGSTRYEYYITNDSGARVKEEVRPASESELYNVGITLLHGYTIKPASASNLDTLSSIVNGGQEFEVSTKGKIKNVFSGENLKTIVAVYQKPVDGTNNKMTVYRLYPIGMLPVVYPAGTGGVEPYINAPSALTYNKEQQSVAIPISTNVTFRIEVNSQGGWITYRTSDYGPTNNSIVVHLALNDTGSDRRGTITLICTDTNVELDNFTITITQTKDELADIQGEIDEIKDDIQELSGRTGN